MGIGEMVYQWETFDDISSEQLLFLKLKYGDITYENYDLIAGDVFVIRLEESRQEIQGWIDNLIDAGEWK